MFNRALLEKIDTRLTNIDIRIYKLELKIEAMEHRLNEAMGVSEVTATHNRSNYERVLELQRKLDAQVGQVTQPFEIPKDLKELFDANNR